MLPVLNHSGTAQNRETEVQRNQQKIKYRIFRHNLILGGKLRTSMNYSLQMSINSKNLEKRENRVKIINFSLCISWQSRKISSFCKIEAPETISVLIIL